MREHAAGLCSKHLYPRTLQLEFQVILHVSGDTFLLLIISPRPAKHFNRIRTILRSQIAGGRPWAGLGLLVWLSP